MLCRLRMGAMRVWYFAILFVDFKVLGLLRFRSVSLISSFTVQFSHCPCLFLHKIIHSTVHFCLWRYPLYPGVLLELEVKIFNIESQ